MATAKKNVWARRSSAGYKAKFAGKKTKATRRVVRSTRTAANSKIANFNSSLQKAWKDVKNSNQKRVLAERKLKTLKAQFDRKIRTLEAKFRALGTKLVQAKKEVANRNSNIRSWATKIVAEFDKPFGKKSRKSSVGRSRKTSRGYSSSRSRKTNRSSYSRRKAA